MSEKSRKSAFCREQGLFNLGPPHIVSDALSGGPTGCGRGFGDNTVTRDEQGYRICADGASDGSYGFGVANGCGDHSIGHHMTFGNAHQRVPNRILKRCSTDSQTEPLLRAGAGSVPYIQNVGNTGFCPYRIMCDTCRGIGFLRVLQGERFVKSQIGDMVGCAAYCYGAYICLGRAPIKGGRRLPLYEGNLAPKGGLAECFHGVFLFCRYNSIMIKTKIHEMFHRFETANPEPKGELSYVNTYTLLVAVILSAQATDIGVNKATAALFPRADTPQKMLALGIDGLKEHIKTIGLYNAKAENVIKMSQILVDQYGGCVPDRMDDLITLPGVGRKTANVVLNIAFGHPTIAVDTHVFRVSNRTGLAKGDTVEKVERKLENVIPAAFKRHAHHWLILHGRYVCKARNPDCAACLIADLCPSCCITDRTK